MSPPLMNVAALHKGRNLIWILTITLVIIGLLAAGRRTCVRERHLAWHRWSGRLLVILGFVVGTSALAMSYTMAIGGANETAATTLFALLFLIFLTLGFWNIRQHRIARHREWMI